MEFKYVPEPYFSEIISYVRQRKEHIQWYNSNAEVKSEVLRSVWDHMQPVDILPRGRQLVNDEEYLSILKDMFNLSNILDDMEQTNWIPYHTRGHYYNVYSRLYRMLSTKAKMQPAP